MKMNCKWTISESRRHLREHHMWEEKCQFFSLILRGEETAEFVFFQQGKKNSSAYEGMGEPFLRQEWLHCEMWLSLWELASLKVGQLGFEGAVCVSDMAGICGIRCQIGSRWRPGCHPDREYHCTYPVGEGVYWQQKNDLDLFLII